MGSTVQGLISAGFDGLVVDIQCHLSNNLPNIVIVGSASKAVGESKERIRGAFSTSRIMLPRKRITINLAPADVPKSDSGFDMAIAVAILMASDQLSVTVDHKQAFVGELGLDGRFRPVRGIIGKIVAGRARGIDTFYIPVGNLDQARLVPAVQLIPIATLSDLLACLNEAVLIEPVRTGDGQLPADIQTGPPDTIQLSQIAGQAQAKRCLEIAAAGGHNLLLSGPPGVGKSMLAQALRSLLPPLTLEESLEVTHLHSLASHNYEAIVTQRPFRSPHHSASLLAIIGGGAGLRPGEISLAHQGVLFLDELPEFRRETLEALRQPLESHVIELARSGVSTCYPANFILVATANPCPCGYYGSSKPCSCSAADLKRYQRRLSGPILDRIDLHCAVSEVNHDKLLNARRDNQSDQAAMKRVARARNKQSRRQAADTDETSGLGFISKDDADFFNDAAAHYGLSSRGYVKTLRVARTIADLDNSNNIKREHLVEALNYRIVDL